MRALIHALTTRGKTFLAIGLAAALSGFGLNEADLLRIGVLLMMLPLLSALAATRARYRLSCTRQLQPRRIPAGHEAEVRIRLSNISRLRTGLLLAEDSNAHTPTRQRFVLEGIEANGNRDLSYRVQMDQRGKYTIGPLQIRVADSFGLVAMGRSFTSKSTLVVTPEISPLPRVAIPGSRLGDGESGMRTVSAAGEDDIAPRAYRDGDELRRVHWRSTARYGELMVRREEQQWHNRALLLIDVRRRAYVGSGPGSPFEFAVSAAASIGVHLVGQGIETRLITDSGEVTPAGPAAEALLERLAVIQPSRNTDLGRGVATLRASSRGQVIAVTGMLSPDQARLLAASHQGTAPAMAMLLDGVNWDSGRSARGGPAGGNRTAADILTAAGWRVSIVTGGTSLAQAWRELHSPATAGFLHRPVSTEAPPIPGPALHVPAAARPEVTG
ncbi:MAG: DUF58 domain-containing protein [Streptosporangiaceae bacterium]